MAGRCLREFEGISLPHPHGVVFRRVCGIPPTLLPVGVLVLAKSLGDAIEPHDRLLGVGIGASVPLPLLPPWFSREGFLHSRTHPD